MVGLTDTELPPYQPTSDDKNIRSSGKENAATVVGLIASLVVGGGISAVQGVSSGLPVGVFLFVIVAAIRIVVYLIQYTIDKLTDEVTRQGTLNENLRDQMGDSTDKFEKKLLECENKCQKIRDDLESEIKRMDTIIISRNRVILRLALAVKDLGGDLDPTDYVFGQDPNNEGVKDGP